MNGPVIFLSSRESLRLPNSGEAADTFEKAWEGGFSSGNDNRTITDLCVTAVSLAHDDLGGVGGYVADKLTS